MQYQNLLFAPPPAAKHAFHLSSDQWGVCGNWLWRFSSILQKWIAPSSSRCISCEWRWRNVTFFDTSYSEREYFPASISIQFLLSMGTTLGEEPASSLLCGFASASDRHAKSFALGLSANPPNWSSGICFGSNSSKTYLTHEKFWPKSECCLSSKTKFWSQLHIYRANHWLQLPIRVQCWFFLASIVSVLMLRLLLGVYSRQATVLNCVKSPVSFVMKYCPFSTTLRNSASKQNLLNLSCCDSFSIRSLFYCYRIFYTLGRLNPKELLSW